MRILTRSYWLRFGRQEGDPCIDFGQVRVVGVPRSFASVFTGHLPLDLSFGELAIAKHRRKKVSLV